MKRSKPKTLRPSLRDKKRYLLVKIEYNSISLKEFELVLSKALLDLYGKIGYAKINFSIIKELCKEEFIVIRCNHKEVEKLRFALSLINEIEGKPVVISCIYVSGTLKAIKKKI